MTTIQKKISDIPLKSFKKSNGVSNPLENNHSDSSSKMLYDIFSVIIQNIQTTTKDEIFNRTSIDINNDKTFIMREFIKSSIFFIFIILSSVFLFYASSHPEHLRKNTYTYIFVIVVPLLIGLYYTSPLLLPNTGGSSSVLYLGIFMIVLCVSFYYMSSNLSATTEILLNYFGLIIVILIIIIALAISYFIFRNYLRKQTGTLGFIITLIFYIPCLFSDFIQYIKEQLKITPNIIFIMFIIEVILLIIYISAPYFIDYILKKNAVLLMMDPMFLANDKVIATSDTFILSNSSSTVGSPLTTITYRDTNYSISFWLYINPNTSASLGYVKESNIINYAGGKPRMTFVCDGINMLNTATIYLSNSSTNTKFENIDLPLQKWNNIVFNYYNNTADFFLNGVLTRSTQFTDDNIPFTGSDTDTIIVGETNGIVGAICNVNYYAMPLPLRQITDNYNLLLTYNPPVIISSTTNGNTSQFKFGKFDYFAKN